MKECIFSLPTRSFNAKKMFPWQNISKNMTSYGRHNLTKWRIGDCTLQISSFIKTVWQISSFIKTVWPISNLDRLSDDHLYASKTLISKNRTIHFQYPCPLMLLVAARVWGLYSWLKKKQTEINPVKDMMQKKFNDCRCASVAKYNILIKTAMSGCHN